MKLNWIFIWIEIYEMISDVVLDMQQFYTRMELYFNDKWKLGEVEESEQEKHVLPMHQYYFNGQREIIDEIGGLKG